MNIITTGWKAARDSRRPHKQQALRRKGAKNTISKRRRQSIKDFDPVLRFRGELTNGRSMELIRREQ